MKLLINKILTRVRNPPNIVIVRFLNKKSLSELWCNFTNVKKSHKKIEKPNLFFPKKKYNISYDSEEKIHFSAYFLLVR